VRIYRDLYETTISGLDEVVGELSSEYVYMRDHLAPVIDIGTPLSKDILKFLRSLNPEMRRLEWERDRIVEEIYGV
jgi:hypothetical protein